MADTEATARAIVEKAKHITLQAKTKITRAGAIASINEFFPELQNEEYSFRTNMPRGVSVPQFCVLGRQAVFDLTPLTEDEFLKTHKIDIRTALDLVERKVLIPNLYFRDPDKWQGFDHMNDLVNVSIANGERVDGFMRLKSPSYDSDIDRHRTDLKRTFAHLSTDEGRALAGLARVQPHEKLEQVCATRWAYLDGFNAQASETAQDYFDKGTLRELVSYIRIAKHNVASRTTAAMGGDFVWGGEDIALRDEFDFPSEGAIDFNVPEEVEYLLTEIVNIRPFQPLHAVDSKALLSYLDTPDIIGARNRILETTDELVKFAATRSLLQASVDEYKRMVEEYRERLAAYQRTAGLAVDAVGAMAGSGVGVFFGGTWGGMFGSAVGAWAGKAVGPTSKKLGRLAFQLSHTNRRADKIISTLDFLKDSTSA